MRPFKLILLLLLTCSSAQQAPAATGTDEVRASNVSLFALTEALNALKVRIANLEDRVNSIKIEGAYAISILQAGISIPPSAEVEFLSFDGTMTFNRDGTLTAVLTGHQNDPLGPSSLNGTASGTWSRSGNTITVALLSVDSSGTSTSTFPLFAADGGRLLVGTSFGPASRDDASSNNLIVLVRTSP